MVVGKESIHTQKLEGKSNQVIGEIGIQKEICLSWFWRACDWLGKLLFQMQNPKNVGECESDQEGLNRFQQRVYADVRQYHFFHSCVGTSVGEWCQVKKEKVLEYEIHPPIRLNPFEFSVELSFSHFNKQLEGRENIRFMF